LYVVVVGFTLNFVLPLSLKMDVDLNLNKLNVAHVTRKISNFKYFKDIMDACAIQNTK